MRYEPNKDVVEKWLISSGTASKNLIYEGNSKEEKEDEE